ncbi:MAG: acetyl/propionyl/methylcrotonyl-CoA carboxylase subunit alpha [Pseudomonadota bacterium]|nr:acetyl/propionyl/methylcrotonyl-CoA carboxylase subunit alpha [Pseudomonadota bacterium]
MFNKILVANRGEIAVRILRSAHDLGYATAAIYSDADSGAPHVLAADEAYRVGPSPASQSYLDIDSILAAAQACGADAVHPGYGFLSENTEFAARCEQAGITFVGPPAAAVHLMGSKRESKLAMLAAEVPCIPGYSGAAQDDDSLLQAAAEVGFPLMVKASAGGGGRGMRLVQSIDGLREALVSARKEALNAFGSDELILERAIPNARHIEIQVFADQHGQVLHLGERDCSVQRRHQKVIEEAPSPFVDEDLRHRMGEAAVSAARACGYVGAGTVEFLVDHERNFYFLEMNTRLQVEHPVTECVTGIDLVAWQFKVAAGEHLPITQAEVQLRGHAIEARLYAEDPGAGFLPQTGHIERIEFPEAEGLRVDSGVHSGQEVSPYYDPMLAKVIAYGESRDEARRRLARALDHTRLFGLSSNKWFLSELLRHPRFAAGEATTGFIGESFAQARSMQPVTPEPVAVALAALIFTLRQPPGTPPALPVWGNGPALRLRFDLQHKDTQLRPTVRMRGNEAEVQIETDVLSIGVLAIDDRCLRYHHQGVDRSCHYAIAGDRLFLDHGGSLEFSNLASTPRAKLDTGGRGQVSASTDGVVLEIKVAPGDTVERGQVVVLLEAMKMEHPLKAEVQGTVSQIQVAVGDQVKVRQLLISIESDSPDPN